jgi:hypothetical protein
MDQNKDMIQSLCFGNSQKVPWLPLKKGELVPVAPYHHLPSTGYLDRLNQAPVQQIYEQVTGFPTSSESSDSSGHRLGSWAAKGKNMFRSFQAHPFQQLKPFTSYERF